MGDTLNARVPPTSKSPTLSLSPLTTPWPAWVSPGDKTRHRQLHDGTLRRACSITARNHAGERDRVPDSRNCHDEPRRTRAFPKLLAQRRNTGVDGHTAYLPVRTIAHRRQRRSTDRRAPSGNHRLEHRSLPRRQRDTSPPHPSRAPRRPHRDGPVPKIRRLVRDHCLSKMRYVHAAPPAQTSVDVAHTPLRV
jgi:hypothetical protein